MTPWMQFTQENVMRVPEAMLGVFQLGHGDGEISFVGRADDDLRQRLLDNLGKGYEEFQYANLPWVKETYEMQCRLYHHAGGRLRLDNADHPFPPEGKLWRCAMSATTPAMCEL